MRNFAFTNNTGTAVFLLSYYLVEQDTDTKTVALLKLNTLIQGISQNTVFSYKCVINEG